MGNREPFKRAGIPAQGTIRYLNSFVEDDHFDYDAHGKEIRALIPLTDTIGHRSALMPDRRL